MKSEMRFLFTWNASARRVAALVKNELWEMERQIDRERQKRHI
jgi:hypothetical protein